MAHLSLSLRGPFQVTLDGLADLSGLGRGAADAAQEARALLDELTKKTSV